MKLELIEVDLLRRAIDLYLEHAYGSAKEGRQKSVDLGRVKGTGEALALFINETGRGEAGTGARRYALRLGNRRYPFMKFVVQEYLIENEFFFSVDTHDQMEIRSSVPDFREWLEIKRFNRELKEEIESSWVAEGLPTFADLKRIVQPIAGSFSPGGEQTGARTILVVDDERAIADSVATLLRNEGYRVVTAYDGAEALRCIHERQPDLVLMDYEMPKMDGIQLANTIRSIPDFQKIPILLATACSMDLSDVKMADGFLVKPYQKDILFSFIHHLLK
jgi:CheY-like chemotaxis protein